MAIGSSPRRAALRRTFHAGSWFQYRSALEARVAPSEGSPVIEVPGYVFGPNGANAAEAEAGWRSACHDGLTETAALAGEDRLDGHSCGAPENLHAGTWFHFGSATVLRLRGDASTGAEPSATVAGPVQGEATEDRNAAVDSWKTACASAIDSQRTALGDVLVAASCGEPKNVHAGSWFQYASDVTVWTGG